MNICQMNLNEYIYLSCQLHYSVMNKRKCRSIQEDVAGFLPELNSRRPTRRDRASVRCLSLVSDGTCPTPDERVESKIGLRASGSRKSVSMH